MAGWKVTFEREHASTVLRWFKLWLLYVAGLVVLGLPLKPRSDEIIFVATLPLWLFPAYVAFCFASAWVKSSFSRLDATGREGDRLRTPILPKRDDAAS